MRRELERVGIEQTRAPLHRVRKPLPIGDQEHPSRFILPIIWTVVVVFGEAATWLLVRSQGSVIAGDSPHYLIAAQSLSHLTFNVLPAYTRDMASHAIFDWPRGTTVTTPYAIHAYLPGPHGPVFAQGLGLPALLSPFMALGSVPGALLGLFTIQAAGVVLVHRRASRLADIGRGGQAVFAVALAAPALWLAATQVYPDLVSGIFLAAGFIELALLEKTGRLDRLGTTVATVSFSLVPWFQIKNAIPALIGILGFAIVGIRQGASRPRLITLSVVVLGSLAALVAYNEFYFTHLLGLPQANPELGTASAWRVVALLADRDQGLFVQVPTALLGVVGLWFARKRNTVSVLAVTAAIGTLLIINGTYPDPPLGGGSFAGRFQWTIAAMLLAWSAVFIGRLQAYPRRLLAVGVAVAGLWAVQLVPILSGNHVYDNEWYAPFRPWDPSIYPGWWPLLNRFLPTFAYPSMGTAGALGRLVLVVVLVGGAGWLLVRLCRPGRWPVWSTVAVGATVAVVIGGLSVIRPFDDLPAHPQAWTGADLGSPWSPGAIPYRYAPIRLLDVGAGRYRADFTYALSGSAGHAPTVTLLATPSRRAVVSKWLVWKHPTDAAPMVVVPAPLELNKAIASTVSLPVAVGGRSATFRLAVAAQSTVAFEVRVPAHADLSATSLTLTKVSSRAGGSG